MYLRICDQAQVSWHTEQRRINVKSMTADCDLWITTRMWSLERLKLSGIETLVYYNSE